MMVTTLTKRNTGKEYLNKVGGINNLKLKNVLEDRCDDYLSLLGEIESAKEKIRTYALQGSPKQAGFELSKSILALNRLGDMYLPPLPLDEFVGTDGTEFVGDELYNYAYQKHGDNIETLLVSLYESVLLI